MDEEKTISCIFLKVWIEFEYLRNETGDNTSTPRLVEKRQVSFVSEPDREPHSALYHMITCRVVVIICALGLIGNILAIVFLHHRRKLKSRRSHRSRDALSAKFDVYCLIVLCLSDLCFCIVLIPQWQLSGLTLKTDKSLMLLYELHEDALVNTFVLSSTWLTVSMTFNRYINLSHPLWAMKHLNQNFLLVGIFVSVLLSLVFNLPRFWFRTIQEIECLHPNNTSVFYIEDTVITWRQQYHWAYFVIGIAIPLCALAYSNTRIIYAMCRSVGVIQRHNQERNIVTWTMIFIVFFYTSLVSPTELLKFFEPSVRAKSGQGSFLLVNAIANLLQAINFSFNFVPYLVLDKSVRQRLLRKRSHGSGYMSSVTSQSAITQTIGRSRSNQEQRCFKDKCTNLIGNVSIELEETQFQG